MSTDAAASGLPASEEVINPTPVDATQQAVAVEGLCTAPKAQGGKTSFFSRTSVRIATVGLIVLVLAIVVTVVLLLRTESTPTYQLDNPGQDIFMRAEDLQKLMSERSVTVLDARQTLSGIQRMLKGKQLEDIPGAKRSWWQDFVDGDKNGLLLPVPEVESRIRKLGVCADRPVVVYGDWREGWGEEGRIYWMLQYLNVTDSFILYGGIYAWNQLRESVGGEPGRAATSDCASPIAVMAVPRYRVNSERIAKAVEQSDKSLVIIDSRRQEEYEGKTPYDADRGGHIPTATHMYWKSFIASNGSLISKVQLRARLDQVISTDGATIVTYCTGGVRSGFLFAVFRWAGYDQVANYDGSWWEWAKNRQLPTA